MCGFVSYENATIREYPEWITIMDELANKLGFLNILSAWPTYQAYPAFGGDTAKTIPILILENDQYKQVDAIWWFDAFCEHGQSYLGKLTSFNARNLSSPFWKGAIDHKRALVLATHLGESKKVGKSKHQYLMQGEAPFLLGAVYKKLANGDYCCAIITRDAHPKMTPYHDKAFPLFMPIDASFMSLWLGKDDAAHKAITAHLSAPKLYPTLQVERVKTYKGRQPVGNIRATLTSDVEHHI